MDETHIPTITDFAVTLAGVTGIVFAIAHRREKIAPLDGFRTLTMLMYSLSAAFGSLIPMAAESFGVLGADIWLISSTGFALILVATTAGTFLASRMMLSEEEQGKLSLIQWALVVGGNSLLIVWLVVNTIGLPRPGPFLIALIWQLLMSSLLFVRIVLARRS